MTNIKILPNKEISNELIQSKKISIISHVASIEYFVRFIKNLPHITKIIVGVKIQTNKLTM